MGHPHARTSPPDRPTGGEAVRLSREARQLRALVAISQALSGAATVEAVVEAGAQATLDALAAASVSISRWEPQRRQLRTLLNVGQLGPTEVARPCDEVYPAGDSSLPFIEAVHVDGDIHFAVVDGPDSHPRCREFLRSFGKESAIAVPLLVDGAIWGELWATTAIGAPRFRRDDTEYLRTISAYLAAAIAGAQTRERIAALAYCDALTGLSNRRAFDEQLEQALTRHVEVVLLVCDVDNLKNVNDQFGHAAGDQALRRTADVLAAATAAVPGAITARLGGDEFCVLLVDADVRQACDIAGRALRELERFQPPLSLSCGVASDRAGASRPSELFRLADAAQFTAKRSGPGRVCVADHDGVRRASELIGAEPALQRRWLRDHRHIDVGQLLTAAVTALDGPLRAAGPADRLDHIARSQAEALDAAGWTLSHIPAGQGVIHTVRAVQDRLEAITGTAGRRFSQPQPTYPLDAYPLTVRAVREELAFVVHVDDPQADAAETSLLRELGYSAVLGAAVRAGADSYLLELYADDRTADLQRAAATLRLLMGEAVRRPAALPPAPPPPA